MRSECLDIAKEITTSDRNKDYGEPEDNFSLIAKLWSNYLDIEISAIDVSMLMTLLKIARVKTGTTNLDNYIDIAGYAACAYEIDSKLDC